MLEKLQRKKKKNFFYYFKKYRLYLLIFSILSFFLVVFLLLRPVIFKSWLDYPLELKAEIAYDYYLESFNQPCFSACLNERLKLSKIVVKAWENDKNYWDKKITDSIKLSNNLEKKKALVDLSLNIYSQNYILADLRNIISDINYSYQIRHYIVKNYHLSFQSDNDLYLNLLAQVIDTSLSLEKRRSALLAVYPWPSRDSLNFCLHILDSHKEEKLKKTALELINSWNKEAVTFKEEDIEFLSNLVLSVNLSKSLSVEIVWLISEYYYQFPSLVESSLLSIYQKKDLDNISQAFSAKALNQLTSSNLEIPEISQKEWDNYY